MLFSFTTISYTSPRSTMLSPSSGSFTLRSASFAWSALIASSALAAGDSLGSSAADSVDCGPKASGAGGGFRGSSLMNLQCMQDRAGKQASKVLPEVYPATQPFHLDPQGTPDCPHDHREWRTIAESRSDG